MQVRAEKKNPTNEPETYFSLDRELIKIYFSAICPVEWNMFRIFFILKFFLFIQ